MITGYSPTRIFVPGSVVTDHSIEHYIRTIPDFPEPGILFRDVSTLFGDPRGFRMAVDMLLHPYAGVQIDKVAALEARGFILGGAIAHQLSVGFVPIRKKGKLPWKTASESYELEYGTDTLEIHTDAAEQGKRMLMVDDLLATGGTMEAAIKLVKKIGGEPIASLFVIELDFLEGRKRLAPPTHSLLHVG